MEKEVFMALLEDSGVNLSQALGRFMGNEALFLSFIGKLPEKLQFEPILQALNQEDEEEFYMRVHSLKGMAGNLSIEPIYDCAQAILVEFRASKFQNKKKLLSLIEEAIRESESLSDLIQQYQKEAQV